MPGHSTCESDVSMGRSRRSFTEEFKLDSSMTSDGRRYSVAQAARDSGILARNVGKGVAETVIDREPGHGDINEITLPHHAVRGSQVVAVNAGQ